MTQQLWRSLDFDRPESLPIPWCLHGDGAPFTETDSIEVISFRCLLTSMPVGDSQLLLAAIPKAAVSKETFNTIMECMTYNYLLCGLDSPSFELVGWTAHEGWTA